MYRYFPILIWLFPGTLSAETEGEKFFEAKVRPVLVNQCYSCHAEGKKEPKGGLRVDSLAALLAGGDSGTALVPGKPDESKLIEAIRYKNVDLQMPPKSKLSDEAIRDLTEWVKMGAPWPGKAEAAVDKKKFDLASRKAAHWAWLPLQQPPVPNMQRNKTVHPVDAFLLQKLAEKKSAFAPLADRPTLIRRLYMDLIGLPPTVEELNASLKDNRPNAIEHLVDQLLQRPEFGEKWARHWLDLVRYAETKGHEFDFPIPNAFQYRDYVIRAINADVPFDQFTREHIAGDLLATPRKQSNSNINESILATGFWFLGEEVHSPVDIHQDEADRIDNRIDVMTKTFLGMTVSCARCHDHKFDAISTKDYYSLYGILKSTSYRQVCFQSDLAEKELYNQLKTHREKNRVQILQDLQQAVLANTPKELPKAVDLREKPGIRTLVDYSTPGIVYQDGHRFYQKQQGEPVFTTDAQRPIREVLEYASAIFDDSIPVHVDASSSQDTGRLGQIPRSGRTLQSPGFRFTGNKLFYLVKGKGIAYTAVGQHGLIHGPLHGSLVQPFDTKGEWQWIEHDLKSYSGQSFHVEFTPNGNQLAVAQIAENQTDPQNIALANIKDQATLSSLDAWTELQTYGKASRSFAKWLNSQLHLQPKQTAFAQQQQEIIGKAPLQSALAPAIKEGSTIQQYVMLRGSPKGIGEETQHRFLEALQGTNLPGTGSHRLALADAMIDPKINPLHSRVMVNRVWHHLFGRGLVKSVDNFGVLGEAPTHPELLDYLANWFIRDGYSLKHFVRFLVLSEAYQQSSVVDATVINQDPENLLYSRAALRRLPGEMIRDSLLKISGRLNSKMGGPSVPIHLSDFQDGRGKPGTGPLDGDGRRSIYLSIKRNFLSPLLLAFDSPIPFSTVGKRSASNVPAQALILLNDPFVHMQAEKFAQQVLQAHADTSARIQYAFQAVLCRPAQDAEVQVCQEFLVAQAQKRKCKPTDTIVWVDFAHVLFNMKEFVYLP